MATGRKAILTAGLGSFAGADPAASQHFGPDAANKTRELRMADAEKGKQAGFDYSFIDFDPQNVPDTLERLKTKLESQHWDAFAVGFGIRGNKAHTGLFEAALNACRTTSPTTVIIFSDGPDKIFEAIQRNFEVDS